MDAAMQREIEKAIVDGEETVKTLLAELQQAEAAYKSFCQESKEELDDESDNLDFLASHRGKNRVALLEPHYKRHVKNYEEHLQKMRDMQYLLEQIQQRHRKWRDVTRKLKVGLEDARRLEKDGDVESAVQVCEFLKDDLKDYEALIWDSDL